jgi:hypothetical protein
MIVTGRAWRHPHVTSITDGAQESLTHVKTSEKMV